MPTVHGLALATLVIVSCGTGATIVVVTVDELFDGAVSTMPTGAVTVAVFGIALPTVVAVPEMTMSQVEPLGSEGIVPLNELPESETSAGLHVAPPLGVTAMTLSAVKFDGTLSLISAFTTLEGPALDMRRKNRTCVPVSTDAIDAE